MTQDKRELALLPLELIAFKGLVVQERMLQREIEEAAGPIKAERLELFGEIEQRLGLETGALGSTHLIDADNRRVEVIDKGEQDGR